MILSVVIPSLNERGSLNSTIPNIVDTIGLQQDEYEILVVNSGGTETAGISGLPTVSVYNSPTRLGAPQARNLGAERSSGSHLVFADAHLKFEEGWGLRIVRCLEENRDSLVAPTFMPMDGRRARMCGCSWKDTVMTWKWLPCSVSSIHEVPFAGAAFIAVRREAFDLIGGWDSGMRFWGGEDYELSLRAWLRGHRVLCDPSITVRHLFRKKTPYEVNWTDISYNKIRIALSHFSPRRLRMFLEDYSALFSEENQDSLAEVLLSNLGDGVLDRRTRLFKEREHDDDWFFERFAMKQMMMEETKSSSKSGNPSP
jgi:glycosyltransferase involved in cell wall biosynthesis